MSMVESETYVGRSDQPFEGSTEYINLAKVWHSGKDIPKAIKDVGHDCLIDFGDSSYDLGHISKDSDGFYGWRTDWGCYTFEEIVQWAYLKDIVPVKLKDGGAK